MILYEFITFGEKKGLIERMYFFYVRAINKILNNLQNKWCVVKDEKIFCK